VPTAACIVATGLARALGVAGFAWAAWLAPLPILWLALRVPPRDAFVAAFVAGLLGSLGSLSVTSAILPWPALAIVTALGAALFAATVAASRAVGRHLDLRLYALAFPVFTAAYEQLLLVPGGFGAEIGFGQVDVLPLAQLASLTGVVGVGFVVSFAPALAATVLALRERSRPVAWVASVGLGLIAAIFAWGALRLRAPPLAASVRVGVAVSDEGIPLFRTESRDEAVEAVDAYLRRIGELARRGAQVVVLPEKLVGVTPAYASEVQQKFSRAAAAGGVWLVAGLNRVGEDPPRNVAWVFNPEGGQVLEYDKVHLVPRLESEYAPGEKLGLLPSAPSPWAVAVCRDLIVAELGQRLGRAGAGLVLDPAWDFVVDGPVMSRVARVRAIEGGFALVRAAKQGFLTVSDAFGRALLATPSSAGAEVLEVVDVVPGRGETLYSRAGDWFGRSCVAIAAALLVALGFRGRWRPEAVPRS
jgi:apolipoprotein N-acyltransferase